MKGINGLFSGILFCFLSVHGFSQTAMFQDKVTVPDPDRGVNDRLGEHGKVSIFGNWAIAGTGYHEHFGTLSGGAFLYEYDEALCDWVFREKILPEIAEGVPDGAAGDRFGDDVDIEGNMIAIGAPEDDNNGFDGVGTEVSGGIVYIYEIVGGTAVFRQRIFAQNDTGGEDQKATDSFGTGVDLSPSHLIVGDPTDREDENGVDMGFHKGAAFIYEWDGTEFVFQDKIISDEVGELDFFGSRVAIYGVYAAVGAWRGGPGAVGIGKVDIYKLNGALDVWEHDATFNGIPVGADDEDWYGACLEFTQNRLVVGSPRDEHDAGGTFIGAWTGAAYVYKLEAGAWSFMQKLSADVPVGGGKFGNSVSIYGNRIAIGSPGTGTGRTYIFEETAEVWNQTDIVLAVDAAAGDKFGAGVSLFKEKLMVCASAEDHNDIPPYDDGFIGNAGSAYFYEILTPADTPEIVVDGSLCVDEATVTLSIAGELNDADEWLWYEGDCDGVPVGSGPTLDVTVDAPVTYCARGVGECEWFEAGDCGCITLTPETGYWHKQTISGIRDLGNDVVTDADGNVYMAGEYYSGTTFPGGDFANETISSGATDRKSYVVKYDNCGNLLWVAYSTNVTASDDDQAVSLVLDEANGFVYVAGNFNEDIIFTSGVGEEGVGPAPAVSIFGAAGQKAYVARFNMNNGAADFINTVDVGTVTVASSITANEITGDIYVGGKQSPGGGGFRLFINRYTPSGVGINPPVWTIDGENFDDENLRDLDYDEMSSSLWAIGDYKASFSLLTSPSVTTSNTDAFVARINDAAIPTLGGFAGGNITNLMYGGGIAVDEATGNAYLTGYYKGFSPNVFGLGQPLTPVYSAGEHVYFLGIDPGMNPVWAAVNNGAAFGGNVRGVDVSCSADGQACFVGYFTNAQADLTGGAGIPYDVVGVATSKPHIFSVSYNAATGAMNWENGTKDNVSDNARHIPTAIATGPFGNAFIGGGFRRNLSYLDGAPVSGDLFTPTDLASFTMRVRASAGGAFQMPVTDNGTNPIEAEEMTTEGQNFDLNVYPNPINDQVTLIVENPDNNLVSIVRILNLDGKTILNQQMNEKQVNIDFSEIDPGVYFIQVTNGNQVAVQRVVKS